MWCCESPRVMVEITSHLDAVIGRALRIPKRPFCCQHSLGHALHHERQRHIQRNGTRSRNDSLLEIDSGNVPWSMQKEPWQGDWVTYVVESTANTTSDRGKKKRLRGREVKTNCLGNRANPVGKADDLSNLKKADTGMPRAKEGSISILFLHIS